MQAGLVNLDKVIALTEREFDLLELEGVDGLEESAETRLRLLEEVWRDKEEYEAGEFAARLLRLRDLQGDLADKALRLHAATRDRLRERKQTGAALNGYAAKRKRSPLAQVITKES